MDTIPIWVSEPEQDEDVKGIFSPDAAAAVLQAVPMETLQQNLGRVCEQVAEALKEVKKVGDFKLKEVSVQVEVSAEGGVELIGTATLGGKGAITLTFGE